MDDRKLNRGPERSSEHSESRFDAKQEAPHSAEVHEVVKEISGGIDSSVESEGNVGEETRQGNEGYEPGARSGSGTMKTATKVYEPPTTEKMISEIEAKIHEQLMTITVQEKKLRTQKQADNKSLNDIIIEKRRLYQLLQDLRNKAVEALRALWYEYVVGKK
jgi:hypothetical protein